MLVVDHVLINKYIAGGKVFRSKYKIIALGQYPQNVKYTQKSGRGQNAVQYQIPDGYIVKTEVADQMLCCETKYTIANKILYTITWKEDAHKKIKQLILQHRMVSESGEPIHLRNMELGYEDHTINIKYNLSLDHIKLDAYVMMGYRRLAAVETRLMREYQVAQRRIEITKLINEQIPIEIINLDKELNQQSILDDDEEHQDNLIGIIVDEQEIGNGVYQSIRNLLQIFIPIWSRSNPPILQPLGGDGRNVGRKQNHVMITICLLNEKDEVLKPDHQYSQDQIVANGWTSLMESDKKKGLQHFPIVDFILGKCGIDIQKLWHNFYDLYLVLKHLNLTNSEINNFENKVK
ncbi:hypothetical protein GLOIN_2v1775128 [Rhizophagus irregularis DAOM 181602=DAOM 197198]|uniref:Uncharacterized protein n=1 Tax=Rhizophagus irregularis (strain DAOM 181602 / DAOM 197198 / MUCL 43194) TaxID=747089 RepID=A0A2P4Q088_RHIID|nr:hypothetical protein GLOIN_2v1775128 [Rhizophagus irregularis DAOM 181602=DAOM 197198]POG71065.1 hypothetical protein GLOIN_2v1775128 [Rhizophagus irregularis DAOM 181602=DAOM 197198]|eukprot:XP_025177931.1 hypothetical protein GLOIN_2v1775128 [Rhizophagus irregularis DAOM 181602=DAOM 197198]